MVDYGSFQFACAPLSGGLWIHMRLRSAGLHPIHPMKVSDLYPPHSLTSDKLRVSLVCKPWNWLAGYYGVYKSMPIGLASLPLFHAFNRLPMDSFQEFLDAYSRTMSGSVGRLFHSYNADTYMRTEDMPWALKEFIISVGGGDPDGLPTSDPLHGFAAGFVPTPDQIQQVKDAEQEMVDAYEYW